MPVIRLDEVLAYARCPLEWFWMSRAGLPRPTTPADLKMAALWQALGFFYEGHTENLLEAMDWVWQDWCASWGEPSVFDDLLRYATTRAGILKQIQLDKGRGASYGERMYRSGLAVLGRRLDEFARAQNRVLMLSEGPAIGSVLGDTVSDCRMAMEQAAGFQEPLPAREECLGQSVRYEVHLDETACLSATCDLAWRKSGDAEGEVSLEVHDMQPAGYVRSHWAKHDLRVIAASLARPPDGATVTWDRVHRVVFRNWPSGTCHVFKETNAGHLHAILATMLRGLRAQVLVPRALSQPAFCRTCVYQLPCWEDGGWEKRHLVDPGTLAQAERLRDLIRDVRRAISGDGLAAQRAREALAVINANVDEVLPDLHAVRAILDEAVIALDG